MKILTIHITLIVARLLLAALNVAHYMAINDLTDPFVHDSYIICGLHAVWNSLVACSALIVTTMIMLSISLHIESERQKFIKMLNIW
jgi:hypothetical protein